MFILKIETTHVTNTYRIFNLKEALNILENQQIENIPSKSIVEISFKKEQSQEGSN